MDWSNCARDFATCQQPPEIARSTATGYGEDLISTAFGLDDGIVETVAHFRGAKAFDPGSILHPRHWRPGHEGDFRAGWLHP